MVRKILAFLLAGALATGAAALAADAPRAAPKNEYVGAKKCMPCHMKIYKAWAEVNHAHAFASLKATTPEQLKAMNERLKTDVKEKPETSAACLGCHVTGYQQPGGYPAADSLKNLALAVVGCEACHGPGSRHMAVSMSDKEGRRKSVLAPTVETCKKCHTDAISPKFDFAVMSQKVHPVAVAAPAK